MQKVKISLVGLLRPFTSVLAISFLPFLLNILVKIYSGTSFGWDYFDGATFCLAIALYSLAMIRNIYKLNDSKLKDDLSRPYKVLLGVFLCLYTLSIHSAAALSNALLRYIADMKSVMVFSWFDNNVMSNAFYISESVFVYPESGINVLNVSKRLIRRRGQLTGPKFFSRHLTKRLTRLRQTRTPG